MFRSLLFILVLLLAGCASQPPGPKIRVIGEGFIGPYEIGIRSEISPRSPEVAKLKHGEKVEIVERRRSFLRIRREDGSLGWLSARNLMSDDQVAAIAKLAADNRKTARLGQATVYDALNIHNEPNRQSPSFAQIPERGLVDVLSYKLSPRTGYQAPNLIEDTRKTRAPRRKSRGNQTDKLPPPPGPASPSPPEDWEELSKTGKPEPKPEAPKQPVRMDDWTLVRTADGRVGWALSSMLIMAIPDEVAQYSEGHRIMGYWPVGEVRDGDVNHVHWLWVTRSDRNWPYDFDGFRIFMYSVKRKRYEQAYREKKVRGSLPVEVVRPGRTKDYLSEFTVLSEDDEGQLTRRRFAFLGYRVQLLDKEPVVSGSGT